MGKIGNYPVDEDVLGTDRWIGTDEANSSTKNFSADSVASFLNNSDKIKSQGLTYFYQFWRTGDERRSGSISLEDSQTEITIPFSSVDAFKISAYTKSEVDVRTFYTSPLEGKYILISNASDMSDWAIYNWVSSTEDMSNPDFFDIQLARHSSSGSLRKNENYIISLLQFSSGGGGGSVDSVNGETGVVVLDTSDISDTLDNRYVTDANLVTIGNTSGTNTGDQDISGIATNSANISTNASNISSNLSAIEGNSTDISTIQGEQTTQDSAIALNTAKITNATHTGEVTGNEALTIAPTAISNKSTVVLSGTEEVLVNDGGTLKKATAQEVADLGGGGSVFDYVKCTSAGLGGGTGLRKVPLTVLVASENSTYSVASDTITINEGTTHSIYGQVGIKSSVQRPQFVVLIYKNGVYDGIERGSSYIRNSGISYDYWNVEFNTIKNFSATDTIEIYVDQRTGGTRGTSSTSSYEIVAEDTEIIMERKK